MWILPASITSAFAPGTEALTSDCVAASQACGRSLMRRSKPSPASCFSREWRAGNLTRLRSGLISSPSLGGSFTDWWTSSLAATRASHLAAQASGSEEKTHATSGRLSQAAFDFFGHESASLKTSKATLPKGSITSCLTWESWVTEQRGDYSRRLKLAHHTSASECSSWPTTQTSDSKGAASPHRRSHRVQLRDVETGYGRAAPANPSTAGSHPESWATPEAKNHVGYQLSADGTKWPRLGSQVAGKLNPRWVETLMGLPVGWTMPSCASPQTIAPTNYDSSATESSQPPQHSPSKP
jgi:hypothetical protein